MLWTILLALVITYAAVLALAFVFQSRLVYFPEVGRAVTVTPLAYGLPFEPHEIETEDGERLHAWWVPVRDARGVALVFDGNAGNISERKSGGEARRVRGCVGVGVGCLTIKKK
jgi:hypothetical protein